MEFVVIGLRLLLAAVFGVAAVAKLTDRADFRRALAGFRVPTALVPSLVIAVPLAELAIATGLLAPASVAWPAAVAAVSLLLAFIAVIGRSLRRGETPDCNCFGRISGGRIGRKTLVRNGILTAAAGVVVAAGPTGSTASAVGWVASLSAAQQVGLAAVAVIAGLLSSQGWLLLNLMRQNGRLLERVVAVENSMRHRTELPLLASSNGANGHHPHRQHGLPAGTPAPAVALPDLDGNEVTVTGVHAGPTILLFWRTTCGYCQQMLPDLKKWTGRDRADAPRLLVVSSGPPEDNRAMGLAVPVLLDDDFATGHRYGASGTPQAVLVNADGTIGSPLAAGAEAVLRLLNRRLNRL